MSISPILTFSDTYCFVVLYPLLVFKSQFVLFFDFSYFLYSSSFLKYPIKMRSCVIVFVVSMSSCVISSFLTNLTSGLYPSNLSRISTLASGFSTYKTGITVQKSFLNLDNFNSANYAFLLSNLRRCLFFQIHNLGSEGYFKFFQF